MAENITMGQALEPEVPPTGIRVVWRELKKDRLAMTSLVFLILLILVIFIGSLLVDQNQALQIDMLNRYTAPNSEFLLGTDEGGRDILTLLLIGARNSILIGVAVTILTSLIGITVGLISGYYGGAVDNVIMRIIDFIMILPTTMLIIVFIAVVPKYNMVTFVLIMSAFYWVGQARLIRSRALAETEKDYISASKTMGTPDWKIIFKELMPNLSSLIIINLTLNFAGNIGIETGLSFLGFGLPTSTPSLGTLISYATSPEVIQNYPWVWLPASFLILVLMICINYVGQALKRSADAKQRLA